MSDEEEVEALSIFMHIKLSPEVRQRPFQDFLKALRVEVEAATADFNRMVPGIAMEWYKTGKNPSD